MFLPQIVYFQTVTLCNGHCRYCPFDDVYLKGELPLSTMSEDIYKSVILWLASQKYTGRIGFLLQYEPTLDDRLNDWIPWTKRLLPQTPIEIATNGLLNHPMLKLADVIDRVPPNTRTLCTSRAGNVRSCHEISQRYTYGKNPCPLPIDTMSIAANGELLLCCQDWRHEAVVGSWENITAARLRQLYYAKKTAEIEMCQDCIAGKTAEEIGERLGGRRL
jgi:hypothetical protein